MNLDWFERVVENLPQELYDVCGLAKELLLAGQLHIYTSKLEKHPTISVVVSFTNGEYNEKALVIHFDPYNQEFYTLVPEDDAELRLMLCNTKEIVDFIHNQLHIGQFAHDDVDESIIDLDALDANEVLQQFAKMVQSMVADKSPHMPNEDYELGEKPFDPFFQEELAESDIEWFPKHIVTESFKKEDEQLQQVTAIRIGQFSGTETFVLGRVNSVTIDGELESETAQLFPFNKSELAALKEVFKEL